MNSISSGHSRAALGAAVRLRPMWERDVAELRQEERDQSLAGGGEPEAVASVTQISARGVPAWLYWPVRYRARVSAATLAGAVVLASCSTPRQAAHHDSSTTLPAPTTTLPASIVVRELRYTIAEPGRRTRVVTLVTTLLDPERYSAQELATLYGLRWRVDRPIPALLAVRHGARSQCLDRSAGSVDAPRRIFPVSRLSCATCSTCSQSIPWCR